MEVVSLVAKAGRIRGLARAVARDPRIMVEVRFRADKGPSEAKLWLEARGEDLRYLDPA